MKRKTREELLMAIIHQKKAEIEELKKFVAQIKQIMPICANCKKVREENGGWTQIESFLLQFEMEFSHGICPECTKKLYPEFDLSSK